jgi:transposase
LWENLLVAKGFRPVVRDQQFLLPPDMRDWLAADHVVWFLIELIDELDLSELYRRAARRRDGEPARSSAGRAAYDPKLLLTLLIYGYACGQRSSRQIERLCHTDVAFRLVCAGDVPDHSVLARFRAAHSSAFAGLFTQVLALCREAGLVNLCTIAIDGSKIAADASRLANRGAQWLDSEIEKMDAHAATADTTTAHTATAADTAPADTAPAHTATAHTDTAHTATAHTATAHTATAADTDAADTDAAAGTDVGRWDREVVERILGEADRIDATEDAGYGAARGDELPPGWNERNGGGRRARIRAAKARLEAIEAERRAGVVAAAAARAERDAEALAAAEQALHAELVARQAAQHAWEGAWQDAAANPGKPVPKGRAPLPAHESSKVRRAQERVDKARARVEHPDTAPRPGTPRPPDNDRGTPASKKAQANVTDPDSRIMPSKNGWIQGYNTQFAVSSDQIILATHLSTSPVDIVNYQPMVDAAQHAAAILNAAHEVGTLLLDTGYASNDTLTAPGPDRLIALGKTHSVQAAARDNPATGSPPPEATARQAMDHRLRTPEGAALYKRRGATVEPGIGNFKKILPRFSRRGLNAAIAETHLAATVFNLLKIHRTAPA